MGPPLISGGNRRPGSTGGTAFGGFNGAAADQRRKFVGTSATGGSSSGASMGPPLISGGNEFSECAAYLHYTQLQWGRR